MAPWLQARLLGLLVAAVGMAGVVSAMRRCGGRGWRRWNGC
jgi:hypothetical protein